MKLKCQQFAKGSVFSPLSSSVITLFNLHFILKHMYRNKQIINSSLSSILCLACKPLTSPPVPQADCWRLADRLRRAYSLFNMSCKQFDISCELVAELKGGENVIQENMVHRLLPFSCLAEGLTTAVLTCFKDKENSIENHGYNQMFLSLWHVPFLCAGSTSWARPYAQHHGASCVPSGALGIMRSWTAKGRVPGKQPYLVGVGNAHSP